MDLNKDGFSDLITGSWTPGDLYVFLGKGGHNYAPGKILQGSDGKPIKVGSATAAAVSDWNEDGHWDLIVGWLEGPVKFIPGTGPLKFGAPEDLLADGKPIHARDGAPCVADWDDDGINDLLLGHEDGRIQFFKGVKQNGSFALSSPENILESCSTMEAAYHVEADDESNDLKVLRPGLRPKMHFADWNDDGKKDLIVGDFTLVKVSKVYIEKHKAELPSLIERQEALQQEMTKLRPLVEKEVEKELGYAMSKSLPNEKQVLYLRTFNDLKSKVEPYRVLDEEYTDVLRRANDLKGFQRSHGYVWVYLRK